MSTDIDYLNRALHLAAHAASQGEVPIGAVVVLDNKIIGEGWNQPIAANDPTAHAEIIALREAAHTVGNYRLLNTTLYVTLEPCLMCAGAMVHARIKRLCFGAYDPKAGAIVSVVQALDIPKLNHRVAHSGGTLSDQCGEILSQFFRERR